MQNETDKIHNRAVYNVEKRNPHEAQDDPFKRTPLVMKIASNVREFDNRDEYLTEDTIKELDSLMMSTSR